jgi:hypothetical protein
MMTRQGALPVPSREWITLGDIDTAANNSRNALARSQQQQSMQPQQIRVKVECIDCGLN